MRRAFRQQPLLLRPCHEGRARRFVPFYMLPDEAWLLLGVLVESEGIRDYAFGVALVIT